LGVGFNPDLTFENVNGYIGLDAYIFPEIANLFDGSIDDFMIFNKALSAAEVELLSNKHIASSSLLAQAKADVNAECDTAVAALATEANLDICRKILQADRIIVTTTTPWTLEYRDKDTAAVLLTKTLKNTSGENITSRDNVLGSLNNV
jgi:predicted dinucleotide-binding enzyme